MLFVTPEERSHRLKTCEACKYYKAKTKSCGTLMRPRTLRNKVKLCGCYMPAKTKFKFSECPAGFWSATVTEADRVKIREYMYASGNLSIEQTRELVDLYSRVTGTSNRYTGCNACLQKMRDELARFYTYDVEKQVEEEGVRIAARQENLLESEKKLNKGAEV